MFNNLLTLPGKHQSQLKSIRIVDALYTIGYEGTDIDRFVTALKLVGVTVLADVRALALSRKKGFSKSALRSRLELERIAYLHFMDLGDPKPRREAARDGRLDDFRDIYAKHLSGVKPQASLSALAVVACDTPTCLMCFERNPAVCHRSIDANRLAQTGLEVFNLYGDQPSNYVNWASQLPRRHSRQGAAAA
jgi:uncharacterized protein (DUF488 family)